jgi:hypothetical protein
MYVPEKIFLMKIPPLSQWPTTQLTWAHGMFWFFVTGVAHNMFGKDVDVEWVALVASAMSLSVVQFGVKRKTQFSPTEVAKAEQIRNGNGFGNGE